MPGCKEEWRLAWWGRWLLNGGRRRSRPSLGRARREKLTTPSHGRLVSAFGRDGGPPPPHAVVEAERGRGGTQGEKGSIPRGPVPLSVTLRRNSARPAEPRSLAEWCRALFTSTLSPSASIRARDGRRTLPLLGCVTSCYGAI